MELVVVLTIIGRGVTRGVRGAQFTGRRVTAGAPNRGGRQKIPTLPQVLSLIQCIFLRKTSVSNMGAPNWLLGPGAIKPRYAPEGSAHYSTCVFFQHSQIAAKCNYDNSVY